MSARILVIACGALAREIKQLKQLNAWDYLDLYCLDAELHNRPHLIPARLQAAIQAKRSNYSKLFAAYADCGTGGLIDQVLLAEGVERLPGAHCYAFFAGLDVFEQLAEEESGSFYLTDFLARHFERLVVQALKLNRYPALKDELFRHYRRLVYLSQTENTELFKVAQAAADYLGLEFKHVHTGYGLLESRLNEQLFAL